MHYIDVEERDWEDILFSHDSWKEWTLNIFSIYSTHLRRYSMLSHNPNYAKEHLVNEYNKIDKYKFGEPLSLTDIWV